MSNEELRLLYEADQEDRRTRRLEGMIERDAERRAQAKVLVDTQCLQTAAEVVAGLTKPIAASPAGGTCRTNSPPPPADWDRCACRAWARPMS